MKTSAKVGAGAGAVVALALPLVALWEGLRTDPYVDLVGKPTVCYGETNVEMRRYTVDECKLMLERSLLEYVKPVLACLPATAPPELKASFSSLAYNNGDQVVCRSNTAGLARAGKYREACEAIADWKWLKASKATYQRTAPDRRRFNAKTGVYYVVSKGLENRRAAERDLCLRGISEGHRVTSGLT